MLSQVRQVLQPVTKPGGPLKPPPPPANVFALTSVVVCGIVDFLNGSCKMGTYYVQWGQRLRARGSPFQYFQWPYYYLV